MSTSHLSLYEKGAITADHLVSEVLGSVDPHDPGAVLEPLPDAILDRMLSYARQYQPGRMVTNYGTIPAGEQVEAARAWIEGRARPREEAGEGVEPEDWDAYQMEPRILAILGSFGSSRGDEHPLLTIYQIAIEFAKRHEPDFRRMGRPLGGTGAGKRALTAYLANQLARRIEANKIVDIEAGFIPWVDLEQFVYNYNGEKIVATTGELGHPMIVYRLRRSGRTAIGSP